jgi:glycosyltransferase involved in cell wall biosynthesis
MDRPEISIIMPAYNHEKFVGEAIESILCQTFADFEFIIVNDGSSDGTDAVIRRYHDKRIKYHTQANSDAYNTLNRCLSLAEGDYIAIINSDDKFHQNRLKTLIDFATHTGVEFIITDLTLIDANSKAIMNEKHPLIAYYRHLKELYLQNTSIIQTMFLGNLAMTTSNFFFSRRIFKEVGYFKPLRYAHDYDYLLRVLHLFPHGVTLLPESLLQYRVHVRNTVRENPARVEIETFRVLLEHLPKFITCENDRAIVGAFGAQLSKMEYVLNDTDVMLQKVFCTWSWKVTAPLRMMGEMFGVEPPGDSAFWPRLRRIISQLLKKSTP